MQLLILGELDFGTCKTQGQDGDFAEKSKVNPSRKIHLISGYNFLEGQKTSLIF